MTHAQAMLETYPQTFAFECEQLAQAIETLIDCANTCTQCADACLAEGRPELARCIRLNLDCADICGAAGRVISRQTEYDGSITRSLLEACLAACRTCGAECAMHASMMEHCAICAESCQRAEASCRALLDAMSSPRA